MNRTQSNIGTAVTLAVALLVAWVCSLNSLTISGIPLFGFCALIIFVIQYVIFIPSYLNQTEHFFDLTGSLTFISISILSVALSPNLSLINILLALMISIWATRLGSFLFWRVRKAGEDKRFTIMKTKFSWFFMTWNIQGLWVLLSLGAALAAISSPKEVNFNVIHILGFLIWLTGFLIEVVADSQKTKFRAKKENEDKFITTGLWSWSRHPNYFGEILLWFGVAIVALPSLEGWLYFALISPIFVFIQLTRISGVSLLEARGRKQWKGNEEYQRYLNRTSILIPMPPKKL